MHYENIYHFRYSGALMVCMTVCYELIKCAIFSRYQVVDMQWIEAVLKCL